MPARQLSLFPQGLKPKSKRSSYRSAEALHPITPKAGVLGTPELRHPKSSYSYGSQRRGQKPRPFKTTSKSQAVGGCGIPPFKKRRVGRPPCASRSQMQRSFASLRVTILWAGQRPWLRDESHVCKCGKRGAPACGPPDRSHLKISRASFITNARATRHRRLPDHRRQWRSTCGRTEVCPSTKTALEAATAPLIGAL